MFYNINVGVEKLKIMEKIDLNNEKCDTTKYTLRYIWIDLIDQNPQKKTKTVSHQEELHHDLHFPSFGALTEDKNDFLDPTEKEESNNTAFKILLPDEDENTFKAKRIRSKTDNRDSTKFYQKKNPQMLRES